ncbi:MAG: hypothetical protein EBY29_12990 [Planctomycetes bacterium]|nr:hypothetical protein [Planctomycetota bacterium]
MRRGGDHRSNAVLGKFGLQTFGQNCPAPGICKELQTKPLQAIQICFKSTFWQPKKAIQKILTIIV